MNDSDDTILGESFHFEKAKEPANYIFENLAVRGFGNMTLRYLFVIGSFIFIIFSLTQFFLKVATVSHILGGLYVSTDCPGYESH